MRVQQKAISGVDSTVCSVSPSSVFIWVIVLFTYVAILHVAILQKRSIQIKHFKQKSKFQIISPFCNSSLPEYSVVPVSLADQDLKQISSFFPDHRIPVSDRSDMSCYPEVWFTSWCLIGVSHVCVCVVLVLESPEWKRSGSHDSDRWSAISEEVWAEVWHRQILRNYPRVFYWH